MNKIIKWLANNYDRLIVLNILLLIGFFVLSVLIVGMNI